MGTDTKIFVVGAFQYLIKINCETKQPKQVFFISILLYDAIFPT